jgi:transcriptional regulator
VAQGEQHWCAVLTEADVLKIDELIRRGYNDTALARRFGVDRSNISQIRRRKIWRHLLEPERSE